MVILERKQLLKQDEGVRLWNGSAAGQDIFMLRSLRVRDIWNGSSEAEANKRFDDEVAESRACTRVRKMLGGL